MKTRLLFVDDEPLVLQGLQRMLHAFRSEWDMVFVPGGAQALEQMARQPFDVVISDMRMPHMNGAQLLGEVMKLYPQTVRIILSGHADQKLIMQCVGSTHQYLSKPCEPAALKATIQRAASLSLSLHNDSVKRLVTRMDRLPCLPSLYGKLVEVLQSPATDLEEVAVIIEQDPGMTAQILKLVNSAFFGLRRQVSGISEAIAYLGVDAIKSLTLSLNAFSQFEDQRSPVIQPQALWDHCLHTAQGARQIAQAEQASFKLADEAFVAGLLHDIGKLILATNYPGDYARVCDLAREKALELWQAEQQVFGCDHTEVGGYLLGLWGLPVPVVEAIALHHRPAGSLESGLSPLLLVHVANALGQPYVPGNTPLVRAPLDQSCLVASGLADHLEAWRNLIAKTSDNAQPVV